MKRFRHSKKIVRTRGAALIGALILCWSAAFGQQKTDGAVYGEEHPLKSNERVERRIGKDEKHIYTITLKRGELLHIRVEQRGINVLAAIAKDEKRRAILKQIDNAPNGSGAESFVFAAETDGAYVFGVFGFADAAPESVDVPESGYVLQNNAPFATDGEKIAAAVDLEKTGDAAFEKKDYAAAILHREHALRLREKLPPSTEFAFLLFNLGNDYFYLQNYARAIAYFQKAAPVYRGLNNRSDEAVSFLNVGAAFGNLKNYAASNEFYEQSRRIYADETKDRAGEADVTSRIGDNFVNLKEFEKALDYHRRALPIFQTVKNRLAEGQTLARIGNDYANLETPDAAVENYEKALLIFRELKNTLEEAYALNSLSFSRFLLNDHARSLAESLRVLKISRELGDRSLEIWSLGNAGNSQMMLGLYEDALASHREALKIAVEIKSDADESIALANIGVVFAERGNYDEAVAYYLKSVALNKKTKDVENESINLSNLGEIYMRLGNLKKAEETTLAAVNRRVGLRSRNGDSFTLANLGTIYMRLKQTDKAAVYFERALAMVKGKTADFQVIYAKIYYGKLLRERGAVERAVALHREAADSARARDIRKYESFAEYELSLDYLAQNNLEIAVVGFEKALTAARAVNARDQAAAALDGLMIVWNRLGKKPLAIFFGKQSINLLQETRGEIVKFDKETQTNFVKDNEQTYRLLAEMLIGEGRLPEAQQVLAMLKEEELSGFVRRDAKEIESLSKRADLRADEKSALERYNLFSSKITEIGAELSKLEDAKRRIAAGETFAERARYDELTAQLKDANTAFRVFLEKELAAELGKEKKKEIEQDRALQGKLKQWGAGVVALSTVIGADRYRVILTTPNAQIDGKTEINSAELNKKIFAFREALLNPLVDPKPLGKELYDVLIKPIEKDLAAANAKTLLWSLDGTLRYVPIAALWDGEQYVVQKYQTVVLTSTTRQSLQSVAVKDWQILGAGVTKASEVTDANTAQKFLFDELKGVSNELFAVVGDGKSAKESASGVRLLDAEFTENALKKELTQTANDRRKYNVVHFATHFRLGGNTADSFLLLGNNQALTLAAVADSPEMDLTDVELVTLSACNTGFSNKTENSRTLAENNGKEIDSLAQFIELRGAKSVMATLWAVADDSTALLMGKFYRLRKGDADLSKAETLRLAQIALLTENYKPEESAARSRSEAVRFGASAKTMPKFAKDEKKPFAHPFYWSPFVLIGNWR